MTSYFEFWFWIDHLRFVVERVSGLWLGSAKFKITHSYTGEEMPVVNFHPRLDMVYFYYNATSTLRQRYKRSQFKMRTFSLSLALKILVYLSAFVRQYCLWSYQQHQCFHYGRSRSESFSSAFLSWPFSIERSLKV